MYSLHKHSYLQLVTLNINPRIINRCVNLARVQQTVDAYDLEPSFNRLTSEQPGIPIHNVDPTRRAVGYGRWAMSKLLGGSQVSIFLQFLNRVSFKRRELHHSNGKVVLEAVTSISDLVHDPEKGYEAIKLGISDRMTDLLVHQNPAIREKICNALTTIASLADGRAAIVKNRLNIKNIAVVLLDVNEKVRFKASVLVEMISRTWTAADELVKAGYIQLLLQILRKEKDAAIIIRHLESLKFLMYGKGKDVALGSGGFEIFLTLMENPDNHHINVGAANCLMMITSTCDGKHLAYNHKLLLKLNNLLHHAERDMYTATASAIMFCTVKSRAKIRAVELLPSLADRLVQLTNDWNFSGTQIYSIKALTNICEHPETRKYVCNYYCDILNNICVGNHENLKRYKKTLLEVVQSIPWNMFANDENT